MQIKELIGQLEKLPPESEIFCIQWVKRDSKITPYVSQLVEIKSIIEVVCQDTNEKVFCLETNYKEQDLWQTEKDLNK